MSRHLKYLIINFCSTLVLDWNWMKEEDTYLKNSKYTCLYRIRNTATQDSNFVKSSNISTYLDSTYYVSRINKCILVILELRVPSSSIIENRVLRFLFRG